MSQLQYKKSRHASISIREWVEALFVRGLIAQFRWMPRQLGRFFGAGIGLFTFHALKRLRQTGERNLELVFPEQGSSQRRQTLQKVYRHLGWHLAEFCKMASLTVDTAKEFVRYEGLENYLAARDLGKGVLVLTGHLGAWELSSFYHSLMGFPMGMVIRRLDNPLVDAFVNRIRCLHGNWVLHKDDFARGLIASMRAGKTVGILMDTNMTPPQGVFVPFFGKQAATASGLARVALKTGAAVVPGFLLWQENEQKYVLRFGELIPLTDTGDSDADAVTNTANFTAVLEAYVRQYPDQWLWMHRRWKTRPQGEEGIY